MGGKSFALRFHLHPDVDATLAHDGQAAILRLPSGVGFRLRCQVVGAGGEVSLAESLYIGSPGERRRSQQVVIAGTLAGAGAEIKWQLSRESRRK